MDSTTTTDPQSQKPPHNQQQQPNNQQKPQQPSSQQPSSHQPSSQQPQSKPQAQARPNQTQQLQQQQQQQPPPQQQHTQQPLQIQQQHQQQHPQHAHQGQPPQATQSYPTMAQYHNYPYTRYGHPAYSAHYAPSPYTPYAPYAAWTPQSPANYTPVQSQPQFAPNMVNSQPQPNVPHNRPSSQTIINSGYNLDRTHNQGLQQTNVMNPPMIATAKPLTARPKQKATLKTPDGKEIKLDDDSSTTKNPSTATTTPSTKVTPTTKSNITAEHVHTLLQKVSEVTVDSKKSGIEIKRAEEKEHVAVNAEAVTVDNKVASKEVEDKKTAHKKAAEGTVVGSSEVEKHETKREDDHREPVENNCVTVDKTVKVEKAIDAKKDVSKESDITDDDKENQIHVQDQNATINNTTTEQIVDYKKVETNGPGGKEVEEKSDEATESEAEKKEDDGSKTDDKDKSSTSLKYEPGQYHPIDNRSGKKKYSREFLMDVRSRIEKEEDLTFPLPVRTDPFDVSARFGYTTNIANRQNDSNRRQGQNNYSGRSSAGQESKRIVITSVSLTQDVELNTSANPWRPTKEVKEEQPQEVLDVEALKKKFRSILNKLTPNNFDSLAQSVTKLNIDTESKLGDVIDIVFAKALAEPGYCVLYGQMCSHLKKTTADGTNFGNTLLKRCQNQFQSDIYAGLNLDERRKTIEDEQDQAVKKQLEEELYEDMYRCRMRGLGLIKFIGELYKIDMLNDAIMFDCVLRLLCDQSEEALECLCDLLITIGEKLDLSTREKKIALEKEKNKPKSASRTNAYQTGRQLSSVVASGPPAKVEAQSLDSVFEQLHKIRRNNDLPLSMRIRFKLLDTCELREKDKWQSKRTKDNNPKKLEEIRKAHEEKLEQEKRVNAMGPRRSQEHRRLGPSGGSSNQISSLANESGGGHRGNLHTSASSHILRDHPTGDMRSNHNADAERKDYQRSLQQFSVLKNLNLSRGQAQSSNTTLRPAATFKRND